MNAAVEDTVKALKGNLVDACDSVQTSSRDAAYATIRQIRKHPGAAVAMAALAGAVVGLLLRRR
ncbi:MAG: hypothetical protein E6R11_06310 [Rhodocyclaceae bacterium]|jgi:ElaB/YqjD/DUF883 family membrane-anchored ribosome-binding protein|nr:MAG: hypothetical protein E6R11_06310 [Rhodocyclaceae bacterium]